jgi:hypothetical protein
MEWHTAVEAARNYIFRIVTPYGSGTGFVVAKSGASGLYGVATAAHVIAQAHEWELPIRLEHEPSGQQILLKYSDRAILIDIQNDVAAIIFDATKYTFPDGLPPLIEENKIMKVGVEVGWLGFPALSARNLCFFHGQVSAHIDNETGYLVDGVAINGVSGGPAIALIGNQFEYVGVVSAYIPNRATGEPLPGLAVIRDVSYFHDLVKQMKSIDEAKSQQATSQEASNVPVKPDQTRAP